MVMVMVCVLIHALIENSKKRRRDRRRDFDRETLKQKFKQVTSQALHLRKKLCLSGLRRVKPRLLNNNRSIIAMNNKRDIENK
jgi:hypothetical protein